MRPGATLRLEGVDSNALERYLRESRSILVQSVSSRWASEIQGIRVTPDLYTGPEDLDRFCEAIEEVASKGLPARA